MRNTKTVSAVIMALLFSLSFLLTVQVNAKTGGADVSVSSSSGPSVMVMPVYNMLYFQNVGNETIYNFTFSLHLSGGVFRHVDRCVTGRLWEFTRHNLLGVNYSSLGRPFGLGPVDLNVSISCDNLSGRPYTSYHGVIVFRTVYFINHDWRTLPLPSS